MSGETDNRLRVLFLAANPADTSRLDLAEEIRQIEEKLEASKYRDSFELMSKWAVRPSDLQHHLLKHQPHIVHFSGHGSKAGEIILKGQDRQARPVSRKALTGLFKTLSDNVRVVVLNACYSEAQAERRARGRAREGQRGSGQRGSCRDASHFRHTSFNPLHDPPSSS